MKDKDASAGSAGAVSRMPEEISRAVLGAIADASAQYPSAVPLPNPAHSNLPGQVLSLFAQEGLVHLAGNSVALTVSGYEAMQQAGRTNQRLSQFLKGGSLPAEHDTGSLLLLTILQAHFQLQSRHTGND